MPVLWKVSQVMFFVRRHNSADRSAAARAQILPGMRNGKSPGGSKGGYEARRKAQGGTQPI
jgi:hypothetical protein